MMRAAAGIDPNKPRLCENNKYVNREKVEKKK
jgi:hypothetical protein